MYFKVSTGDRHGLKSHQAPESATLEALSQQPTEYGTEFRTPAIFNQTAKVECSI